MSFLKNPSAPWLWHEGLTGLAREEAVQRPMVELVARITGRIMQQMVDQARQGTALVNYDEVADETPQMLLRCFGITDNHTVIDKMREVLNVYSKDGSGKQQFMADSERKQTLATPLVRSCVAEFAINPYLELERRRSQRRSSTGAAVPHSSCQVRASN